MVYIHSTKSEPKKKKKEEEAGLNDDISGSDDGETL